MSEDRFKLISSGQRDARRGKKQKFRAYPDSSCSQPPGESFRTWREKRVRSRERKKKERKGKKEEEEKKRKERSEPARLSVILMRVKDLEYTSNKSFCRGAKCTTEGKCIIGHLSLSARITDRRSCDGIRCRTPPTCTVRVRVFMPKCIPRRRSDATRRARTRAHVRLQHAFVLAIKCRTTAYEYKRTHAHPRYGLRICRNDRFTRVRAPISFISFLINMHPRHCHS